jgi:hypothetical protein
MNPDDMYLQTFLCVYIYIKKSKLSFFLFLSMESCWVPQLHRRKEEERARRMAGSPLSLSLQLLRLFLAALSAMHAAFLTSLSLSHPPAFYT